MDEYATAAAVDAYHNKCAGAATLSPVQETDLMRLNNALSSIDGELISLTRQLERNINRIVGVDGAAMDAAGQPEPPVGGSLPEAWDRAQRIGSRLADLAQQVSRLGSI